MLQIVIVAVFAFGFLFLAARKRAMVPGRLQFSGESAYGFVRNSMGRDIIGSHDFMRFVPYLVTRLLLHPVQQPDGLGAVLPVPHDGARRAWSTAWPA